MSSNAIDEGMSHAHDKLSLSYTLIITLLLFRNNDSKPKYVYAPPQYHVIGWFVLFVCVTFARKLDNMNLEKHLSV